METSSVKISSSIQIQLFKSWTLSFRDNIREGEKGLGAVQSGAGAARVFARMFLALCSRGDPFMGENAHGIPCEGIPLSPSHAGGERKRKSCGATSEPKVPTRGFSAKKETVWRDLPAIFHNSAKKEGRWRNLSKEKCRLADFRRKRKPCGATSKICQIFFISLCTSTD